MCTKRWMSTSRPSTSFRKFWAGKEMGREFSISNSMESLAQMNIECWHSLPALDCRFLCVFLTDSSSKDAGVIKQAGKVSSEYSLIRQRCYFQLFVTGIMLVVDFCRGFLILSSLLKALILQIRCPSPRPFVRVRAEGMKLGFRGQNRL